MSFQVGRFERSHSEKMEGREGDQGPEGTIAHLGSLTERPARILASLKTRKMTGREVRERREKPTSSAQALTILLKLSYMYIYIYIYIYIFVFLVLGPKRTYESFEKSYEVNWISSRNH